MNILEACHEIVISNKANRISGVLVDVASANMVVQTYNKLSRSRLKSDLVSHLNSNLTVTINMLWNLHAKNAKHIAEKASRHDDAMRD